MVTREGQEQPSRRFVGVLTSTGRLLRFPTISMLELVTHQDSVLGDSRIIIGY